MCPMRTARPTHVLIGFSEVAGYYRQLALGLNDLGVRTTVLTVRAHPFAYGSVPDQPILVRVANRLARVELARGSALARRAVSAVRIVLLAGAFAIALVRCDSFIIGFPYSSAHRAPLALLRGLRRRVVTVFHGGDHRPPYCDGGWAGDLSGEALAREAERRRRIVAAAERAGSVVGNPLSGQLHTKALIGFQVVGVPCEAVPLPDRDVSPVVRLLHAPSKPSVKGTDRIRGAVEALQANGVSADYRELVGVPNDEVREALLHCDLVIDQCYSDTTMAGFAAEAAVAGAASLFGSYGADALASVIPSGGRPPAICVEPDELSERLAAAVADRNALRSLAVDAHAFVTSVWERSAVASRFLTILQDGPDPSWVVAPDTVDYLWGCGVTPDEVARRTGAVLSVRGETGLALPSQPRTRAAFVRAASDPSHRHPTARS